MIERGQQCDCRTITSIDQRSQTSVDADQIVQPPGRQELRIRTKDHRRRGVEEDQIESEDVASRAPRQLAQVIEDPSSLASAMEAFFALDPTF